MIFVAYSKILSGWGADVGLGKNLFLVGITADDAETDAFLAARPCAADDWKILKKAASAGAETEIEAVWKKLAAREKRVEPGLYPRLRGFGGVFKVKIEHVENHLMLKMALENMMTQEIKVKTADMAAYLLHLAQK